MGYMGKMSCAPFCADDIESIAPCPLVECGTMADAPPLVRRRGTWVDPPTGSIADCMPLLGTLPPAVRPPLRPFSFVPTSCKSPLNLAPSAPLPCPVNSSVVPSRFCNMMALVCISMNSGLRSYSCVLFIRDALGRPGIPVRLRGFRHFALRFWNHTCRKKGTHTQL